MRSNITIGPIIRGTTYILNYRHYVDGDLTSLENHTVYFTVKPVKWDTVDNDSSAVIQKTIATAREDGSVDIELTPQDTNIPADIDYYFDIRVKDGQGHVYAPVEGRVQFDGSPTNRSAL